jgi:hypothetical protein
VESQTLYLLPGYMCRFVMHEGHPSFVVGKVPVWSAWSAAQRKAGHVLDTSGFTVETWQAVAFNTTTRRLVLPFQVSGGRGWSRSRGREEDTTVAGWFIVGQRGGSP